MPYTLRSGDTALTLDGTALAVLMSTSLTAGASPARVVLRHLHPDAHGVAPVSPPRAPGPCAFRACDYTGAPLLGADGRPRAPVTLDVVAVSSLALGARAFVPNGDGVWVDAIVARTPTAAALAELGAGGSVGGYLPAEALPLTRPVSVVRGTAFTAAAARAMLAGQTSGLPGLERYPAVTLDRTASGRPVFVGGADEFQGEAFTTVGALTGPDPSVVLLVAEADGTPQPGDLYTALAPALLV